MLQAIVVALLVLASFAYAAWTLMSRTWQRILHARLLRLPGAGRWVAALPVESSGCGSECGTCKAGPTQKAQPRVQPLVFHPKQ
jgi:hypothetical protein